MRFHPGSSTASTAFLPTASEDLLASSVGDQCVRIQLALAAERLGDKREHLLRYGIALYADLVVETLVRSITADDLCRDSSCLENVGQASSLRAGVGVARDVKDEERRNALVRRHVGHGGEVEMLRRVIAELLSMTVGWRWQVVHASARFGHLDDCGDVEGVGIHGHASLDRRQ